MKKFTVTVEEIVTKEGEITVDAENEDEARTKVLEEIARQGSNAGIDWEVKDYDDRVVEIRERR